MDLIDPIPVPFMDQRELRKGRIAQRPTVDTCDKDEVPGSSPGRPTTPALNCGNGCDGVLDHSCSARRYPEAEIRELAEGLCEAATA
jgi:hypothetical protein